MLGVEMFASVCRIGDCSGLSFGFVERCSFLSDCLLRVDSDNGLMFGFRSDVHD